MASNEDREGDKEARQRRKRERDRSTRQNKLYVEEGDDKLGNAAWTKVVRKLLEYA